MKQSSIEWIYNNLKSHFEHDGDLLEVVKMSFEQAKAMHESESVDSYVNGMYKGQELCFSEHKIKLDNNSLNYCVKSAEQYYNETFNTKEK